MRRFFTYWPASLPALLLLACGNDPSAPPSAASLALGSRLVANSQTHGLDLQASASGPKMGIVNLTSTAAGPTTFNAQINFNVHGLAPNTTYTLSRASEFGTGPTDFDGLCQRAAGEAPWVGAVPFIPFPVTLTTSAGGAGSAHVVNQNDVFPDGSQFDVMFRVSNGTTDLRTDCITVEVK
jgi:hypothetical protein